MNPTTEVRWFLRGKAPVELSRWFGQGAITPTAETRADWYLHSTENSALGIKLREAKLEIKQRLNQAGIYEFAQTVHGQVENWVKWEFLLSSGSDLESNVPQFNQSDGFWVLVKKERLSKYYCIAPDGTAPVEVETQTGQGYTLELTQLQVWDQDWHSLGLETFGDIAQFKQPPEHLFRQVFAGFDLVLQAADSFGYPQWLQKLAP
jgi:hypothetical protein